MALTESVWTVDLSTQSVMCEHGAVNHACRDTTACESTSVMRASGPVLPLLASLKHKTQHDRFLTSNITASAS